MTLLSFKNPFRQIGAGLTFFSLLASFGLSLNVQAQAASSVVLPVPYFNQCLEADQTTYFPNNTRGDERAVCRNMCTAAVMVMVGGYFKKLEFDPQNPSSLKKYMYSNSGQNVFESCGENQGGAFGMIARETDAVLGTNDCSYGSLEGMNKYAAHLGLSTREIPLENQAIVEAINRGNPVILGSLPHVAIIKGYNAQNGKFIMNDPYRNTEIDQKEFSYNGQNAEYDLPETFYFGKTEKFTYALEVSEKTLYNTDLVFGDRVVSTVEGDGMYNGTGLSVRQNPCNPVRLGKVDPSLQGIIIESRVVEYCNLGNEFKVWHRVDWGNGLIGWSAANYLKKV